MIVRGGPAAALLLATACASPGLAPEPGSPPGPPPVLASPAPCEGPGSDRDGDGLADGCEDRLAAAFAPLLISAPEPCAEPSGPPSGGWFHGAAPVVSGVRLVYLPAYFRDCGWSGAKCRLPWVDCAGHAGDSEFIALDVARESGGWRVHAVFLSAHCFGRSAGACRWYRGAELERFAWVAPPAGGGPEVWVAEGRHANYPSRDACDAGHRALDTCDRNAVRTRFPVLGTRNVGSEAAPAGSVRAAPGCVSGADLAGDAVADGAVECFWSPVPFRGWQDEGPGATPYVRYLDEVAGLVGGG